MREIDKEFDLLISQRNQLVEDLSHTYSSFQKIVLAFFTGLISVLVADSIESILNKTMVLFLLQIIIMITFFISALLISGNIQCYYISAIDDYIFEEYGISVLFYQGTMGRTHTIGKKSFFTFITYSTGLFAIILSIWVFLELDIWQYVRGNVMYIILTTSELIAFVVIVIHNMRDKLRVPKIYTECLEYLKRKKEK